MENYGFNELAGEAESWTSVYARRAFNKAEKSLLYKRAKGHCEYCGKWLARKDAEFDHKHPFSKGGPTTLENGALACKRCNSSKKAKSEKPIDVAGLFFRRVYRATWRNFVWDNSEKTLKYINLMM